MVTGRSFVNFHFHVRLEHARFPDTFNPAAREHPLQRGCLMVKSPIAGK